MSRIREIRERLGLTQEEFAKGLGCTQGNVGHYERGQVLLPDRAIRLVEFAHDHGLLLTLDIVYGRMPLPPEEAAPRADTFAPPPPAAVDIAPAAVRE
jgi:putative transcriptional regulator